jgi:hypothetical protein
LSVVISTALSRLTATPLSKCWYCITLASPGHFHFITPEPHFVCKNGINAVFWNKKVKLSLCLTK